jgi:hypothetical protein
MDIVFNNDYLVEIIAATDPSLEVFCKLVIAVPMFARFVKANPGVRQAMYRLHDGWLRSWGAYGTPTSYRHPFTGKHHRLSGPAVVDGNLGHIYKNGIYLGTRTLQHFTDLVN